MASITTTTSTESNQGLTSSTKLSEEAKQRLLELQMQLQEQQRNSENSKYIKFKKGQDYKVLRIDPERTQTEYVSYNNNANQRPTLQYKFYASELIDKKELKWSKVREWTVSPRWAKLIIPLLLKGFLTLEVTRTGSGINDTSYSVAPFVE
jgi:hypothetical protein